MDIIVRSTGPQAQSSPACPLLGVKGAVSQTTVLGQQRLDTPPSYLEEAKAPG